MKRTAHIGAAAAVAAMLILARPAPVRADQPFHAPDLIVVITSPQRGQAVLFDPDRSTYRVVRRGDRIGAYAVFAIERRQVVLRRQSAGKGSGREEFYVLPLAPQASAVADSSAGPPHASPHAAAAAVSAGNRVSSSRIANPIDPYAPRGGNRASSDIGSPTGVPHLGNPIDPYAPRGGNQASHIGSPTGVPQLTNPIDPYAARASSRAGDANSLDLRPAEDKADADSRPIPSVVAPPKSRADTPAPVAAGSGAARPPGVTTSRSTPPEVSRGRRSAGTPDPSPRATPVSRRRFMKAIADFATLSEEVQVRRGRHGGARITGIARGSLFFRLGLRKGDLVRKVAGIAIDSMDDAASVYAKLMRVSRFSVEVTRGPRQLVLRCRFTH